MPKKPLKKRAKVTGGNSNPDRQKQTKRNQRRIPLTGKKCANCGSTSSLQRHETPPNSGNVKILCQKCHAKLHVKKGTWAWEKPGAGKD